MIHKGMLKIGDSLYLVRYILSEDYDAVAQEWNKMSELNKTFKRDSKMYFCELIEEAIIDENVDNPII
jgi:hypothetical protein